MEYPVCINNLVITHLQKIVFNLIRNLSWIVISNDKLNLRWKIYVYFSNISQKKFQFLRQCDILLHYFGILELYFYPVFRKVIFRKWKCEHTFPESSQETDCFHFLLCFSIKTNIIFLKLCLPTACKR